MLYSLKEITIIPATISDINSRSECNTYYDNMLPLFTAPMSSVVGIKSFKEYLNNKINPIIPRNVLLNTRLNLLNTFNVFVSFSLKEIEENFIINTFNYKNKFKILIDIANGNMQKMFDLVKQLKEIYKDNIIIMSGNIANPKTYREYCRVGIDYCRVGIGGGSGCLTSTNTGIHYPLATLLQKCNDFKNYCIYNNINPTKIIADGGIKNYSDIIKCLALGADYVMCGSLFAKMKESEGEIILDDNKPILYKKFYGMSTPKAQIELGGDGSKATEGKEIIISVEYTMKEWVDNFTAYLKSTMSYCGKRTLSEFIGKVQIEIMSENSINSINK